MSTSEPSIGELLAERGMRLFEAQQAGVSFTQNADADRLLNDLDHYPHAFVIACLMDRQMRAERAWLVPFQMAQRLGGFEFKRLSALDEDGISQVLTTPTPLHRFSAIVGRHLFQTIRMIRDRYQGDASRIWRDKPSSATIVYRFLQFPGIGPKIATMAANILARDFKIPMADYYSIDISVDVHVRRVFTRLGLVEQDSSVEAIVYRARSLYPQFPGVLDFPCWEIGRNWCKPQSPLCGECPMGRVCPTALGSVVA